MSSSNGICKAFQCATLIGLLLSGCATTGKSIVVGATSGAALGAGIGALADPGPDGAHHIRNVLIGTSVGAALGAGGGYLIHQSNKSSENEGYQRGAEARQKDIESRANSPEAHPPELIPARTEAHWVPDTVRANTFVPGHFEYSIVQGARWNLEH